MADNVINLIRRDFYALWTETQGGPIWYILFIIGSLGAPLFELFSMLYLLLLIPMYGMNIFSLDEKYRTERFFASLPVRRSNIVLARYLEVVVIVALHLALAYACNLVIKLAGVQRFQITPGYCAVALIIASLWISFSFPCYFKSGITKALKSLILLPIWAFPGILIAALIIQGLSKKIANFSFTVPFTTSLLLTGIAILLFVVSLKISTAIYSKRDL